MHRAGVKRVVVAALVSSLASVEARAGHGPAVCGPQQGDETQSRPARPAGRSYQNPPEAAVGTLPAGIGIPVGERAPNATLRDSQGREARLLDLTKASPVLVVFYRGGWCPFCNAQIHDLTTAYPEFQKRGVGLVAISVDRVYESAETQATYTIPFPVVSDPDLAVPSLFLVDSQGVVRWAHADPDYKVRPSTVQVLAAVDGVGLRRPEPGGTRSRPRGSR